ncbi:MAG: DUF4869 domain-containing protein [Lachnospiraceae bacterium]|nr:DUF4869 domain-containing protein [Lachnospiraceae bacterium]
MLKIHTKIPKEKNFILDAEAYFYAKANELVCIKEFDDIIKSIDDATVIVKEPMNCIVKTKFGTTVVQNISTGCKSLIVAVANPNMVVNFNEAGDNVIDKAIELARKLDMNIWLNVPLASLYDDDIVEFDGEQISYLEAMRRLL